MNDKVYDNDMMWSRDLFVVDEDMEYESRDDMNTCSSPEHKALRRANVLSTMQVYNLDDLEGRDDDDEEDKLVRALESLRLPNLDHDSSPTSTSSAFWHSSPGRIPPPSLDMNLDIRMQVVGYYEPDGTMPMDHSPPMRNQGRSRDHLSKYQNRSLSSLSNRSNGK